MTLKSTRTQANDLLMKIKTWIYEVFNREVFGTYEGVVETFDTTNAIASVRVIDLDDLLIDNCRYAYPAYGLRPALYKGMHVLIQFCAFNLEKPVITGYLPATDNPIGFLENQIVIENGNSKITINTNSITINSNIVTANGEDLTYDDEGSM